MFCWAAKVGRRDACPAVWTFSGLKARDVTAWGEAQRAKPQVKVRKENPLRAESAGHRMPLFCFGLSGLGEFGTSTWASARYARSRPGCNIAGFQPDNCPNSRDSWKPVVLLAERKREREKGCGWKPLSLLFVLFGQRRTVGCIVVYSLSALHRT